MDKTEWTITELEADTGVSRRTIHFYIQQGLIAPPEGTGGGAHYKDEHRVRLLLIREMQRSHLKLSGIREALDALSLEEMRTILEETGAPSPIESRESLEKWLQGEIVTALKGEAPEIAKRSRAKNDYSFAELLQLSSDPVDRTMTPGRISRTTPFRAAQSLEEPEAASWDRLILADGLELHVRSDVSGQYSRLADLIRDLLRKKDKGRTRR